jgi:hypothetical protein
MIFFLPTIFLLGSELNHLPGCPSPYPLLTSDVFSEWRMEGGVEGF